MIDATIVDIVQSTAYVQTVRVFQDCKWGMVLVLVTDVVLDRTMAVILIIMEGIGTVEIETVAAGVDLLIDAAEASEMTMITTGITRATATEIEDTTTTIEVGRGATVVIENEGGIVVETVRTEGHRGTAQGTVREIARGIVPENGIDQEIARENAREIDQEKGIDPVDGREAVLDQEVVLEADVTGEIGIDTAVSAAVRVHLTPQQRAMEMPA